MTLHNRSLISLVALILVGFGAVFNAPAASGQEVQEVQDRSSVAVKLKIKGAIGPATSDYIVKGIAHAADTNARLIIIEMDTPGGLDSAMRDIIKAILNSDIPVVSYVSPSGARAASAGTYILYASHVAAMAPATNLGAATPVQIGSDAPIPAKPPDKPDPVDEPEQSGPAPDNAPAMTRKAVNDAVAYIRGLAELHDRNADWAEQAVREAASLSAEDAREQNVIDLVADSIPALLDAIDGRTVKVDNQEQLLETDGLTIEPYDPDWRTRLLAIITDPNIAYMLMLAGIYGLLFEGYNPGAIVPGVVGAICLLLALFAFQVLPVNYAGLALILLGVMLIIGEAFVPSFGALGMGGVAAFVFGSIILLDTDVPGMSIARSLIVGMALAASTLLLALVYALMRMRRRPIVSGVESMLGMLAEALEDFDKAGTVFVNGERWNARTDSLVHKGDKVRIMKINGLVLEVAPV